MSNSSLSSIKKLERRLLRPESYSGVVQRPLDKLKWREIDRDVRSYADEQTMNVLQIGANDGRHSDPINRYIKEYGWGGVLVEPVPRQFDRLVETYRDNHQLQFVNSAITNHDGTVEMYSSIDHAGALQGKDTIHQEVLDKHSWMVDDFRSQIEKIEVEAMTLQTLLGSTGLRAIDFLVIDTEGHDKVIFDQFDLDKFRPQFVMIEHCHVEKSDKKQLQTRLGDAGYRLTNLRRDIFAAKMSA